MWHLLATSHFFITSQNLYLFFCLLVITNELLESDLWNFV